jgi:hypothetical protein
MSPPLVPKTSPAVGNPAEPGDLPWTVKLGLLGEWFRRKNRGRRQTLLLPESNRVTLVETVGEDSLSAQTTVACSLLREDAPDSQDRPAVVGFVRWGTDGYQHAAEFDFINGVQLAVAGSYVEVTAAVDNDAPGNGSPTADPPTFHPVLVGATIGYVPPATRPVTRTRYAAFAGAGAVTVDVPAFAREVTVLKSVAGTAITVEQLDRAGTTLVLETSTGQISQLLVNDCRTVRLTAAGAMLARAVFALYL